MQQPHAAEVLVGLARVEGQMSTLIQLTTSQGDAIVRVSNENAGLRDRVTALETAANTAQKASTPWHASVGAIVPSVALLLVVAERLFAK